MPSTGTPSSSSSVRSSGAPSAYTEAGPPDSTMPRGRRCSSWSRGTSCRSSSENTPHSRIRRAISCEYCPPKSSTSTSSVVAGRSGAATEGVAALLLIQLVHRCCDLRLAVGAHAHVLLALELLALAHEGRRDHHLRTVEGRDVLVAAGGHRGAEGAEQVEGAVVLGGGAEQDLLERAVLERGDARAARQRRVEGGHAPVVAAAGRLVGARERRADHDGVGSTRERLRDVAAIAHATVGEHVHILAGLEHVLRAR